MTISRHPSPISPIYIEENTHLPSYTNLFSAYQSLHPSQLSLLQEEEPLESILACLNNARETLRNTSSHDISDHVITSALEGFHPKLRQDLLQRMKAAPAPLKKTAPPTSCRRDQEKALFWQYMALSDEEINQHAGAYLDPDQEDDLIHPLEKSGDVKKQYTENPDDLETSLEFALRGFQPPDFFQFNEFRSTIKKEQPNHVKFRQDTENQLFRAFNRLSEKQKAMPIVAPFTAQFTLALNKYGALSEIHLKETLENFDLYYLQKSLEIFSSLVEQKLQHENPLYGQYLNEFQQIATLLPLLCNEFQNTRPFDVFSKLLQTLNLTSETKQNIIRPLNLYLFNREQEPPEKLLELTRTLKTSLKKIPLETLKNHIDEVLKIKDATARASKEMQLLRLYTQLSQTQIDQEKSTPLFIQLESVRQTFDNSPTDFETILKEALQEFDSAYLQKSLETFSSLVEQNLCRDQFEDEAKKIYSIIHNAYQTPDEQKHKLEQLSSSLTEMNTGAQSKNKIFTLFLAYLKKDKIDTPKKLLDRTETLKKALEETSGTIFRDIISAIVNIRVTLGASQKTILPPPIVSSFQPNRDPKNKLTQTTFTPPHITGQEPQCGQKKTHERENPSTLY